MGIEISSAILKMVVPVLLLLGYNMCTEIMQIRRLRMHQKILRKRWRMLQMMRYYDDGD